MTPRNAFARPGVGTRPLNFAARLAAFLAVGLLTFAGVKSTVMQALDSAPAKMASACPMGMPDMPGMDMSAPSGKADKSGGGQTSGAETCPFCVAAAHVALQAVAEPIPAPVSVAWVAPPPISDRSARGPPLVQPRARGPPIVLQTV